MKIGQTFKYRHPGQHHDVTLIILADEHGRKYLFNLDYNIRVGEAALLNAIPSRVYTKPEVQQAVKGAIDRAAAERAHMEKHAALMKEINEINERVKNSLQP